LLLELSLVISICWLCKWTYYYYWSFIYLFHFSYWCSAPLVLLGVH